MEHRRKDIRNIAIIAHVDHGKTTLVDAMLKQTGEFKVRADEAQETVMDANPLERERGITILAKCTSVPYKGHTINIVDTPGHADFGSEVERILQMVDGALLLVDAVDGPMPQTRFVLRKALELGLAPIVVVNKLDRPNANPRAVINAVGGLFIDLGATDSQLEFPSLYACGKDGWASVDPDVPAKDLSALFEAVLKFVPPPLARQEEQLQMLVTMLEHNSYLGQTGIGRIFSGSVKRGQQVEIVRADGSILPAKAAKLERFSGLARIDLDHADAGDIIAVAGLEGVNVGDTVCAPGLRQPLNRMAIEEPTISIEFLVNDSPFAGRDGKWVTSRHLKDRLEHEARINVGLKLEYGADEGRFKVSGRGELHLAILIETMRREGFEMSVSAPEVIYRQENGVMCEPAEYLVLDLPSSAQGAVFELLGQRGASMKNMASEGADRLRLEYIIPSRSLIGFKSEFLTATRGVGVMHHSFHGYVPRSSATGARKNGVFIAKEAGISAAYALYSLQDGGTMFINPGVDVYEGMLVGQNARPNDLVVNPCKQKKLTNMRTKAADEAMVLTPPWEMTLEQAIEFIAPDELVEVTPKNIRLRKKVLEYGERKKFNRQEERREEE
ncbi:MAG: translational GTPase TypA [Elusimicrobia bacterium]|nr:translational GTPase TypA [Elusimicrobiota bacterium]